MTRRHYLGALALAALLAAAGGLWYTTPSPPAFPLEGRDPAVVEVVQTALDGVRQAPRSAAAWGKLALVAAVNGYTEPALACLEQAEKLDPDDPRWPYLRANTLLAGRPHEALPLLQQALAHARNAQEDAAIRFRLALVLLEAGRLDEADEQLAALAAVDTDNVRVSFGRGLLAAARDERAAARTHLEAVESSPFARKQAQSRLAALALADGHTAVSHRYQQRLAALPSDLPWPDPFVEEMNSYATGRQHRFLEAESLEANGKGPQALALYRDIAAQTPDARSYLALGVALARLGNYREADEVLRATIRMDAYNLQGLYHLGAVLFAAGEQQAQAGGDRERARKQFLEAVEMEDRALSVHPDHAMAHLTRGRALVRLRRMDEAIRALREAVLGRPEFADTHLSLGEALAEAGQLDEALAHLRDAVRFARPDDPRPRQALEKWRGRKIMMGGTP